MKLLREEGEIAKFQNRFAGTVKPFGFQLRIEFKYGMSIICSALISL